MKLSFGMKARRQKFTTQFAHDEDDEDEQEAKRLKSERTITRRNNHARSGRLLTLQSLHSLALFRR